MKSTKSFFKSFTLFLVLFSTFHVQNYLWGMEREKDEAAQKELIQQIKSKLQSEQLDDFIETTLQNQNVQYFIRQKDEPKAIQTALDIAKESKENKIKLQKTLDLIDEQIKKEDESLKLNIKKINDSKTPDMVLETLKSIYQSSKNEPIPTSKNEATLNTIANTALKKIKELTASQGINDIFNFLIKVKDEQTFLSIKILPTWNTSQRQTLKSELLTYLRNKLINKYQNYIEDALKIDESIGINGIYEAYNEAKKRLFEPEKKDISFYQNLLRPAASDNANAYYKKYVERKQRNWDLIQKIHYIIFEQLNSDVITKEKFNELYSQLLKPSILQFIKHVLNENTQLLSFANQVAQNQLLIQKILNPETERTQAKDFILQAALLGSYRKQLSQINHSKKIAALEEAAEKDPLLRKETLLNLKADLKERFENLKGVENFFQTHEQLFKSEKKQ